MIYTGQILESAIALAANRRVSLATPSSAQVTVTAPYLLHLRGFIQSDPNHRGDLMKTTISILLFVLATSTWQAAVAASAPPPLRSSACIDTTQINEWHIVDARTAIVRTGPKRYRIDLKNDCPRLNHPPGLMFSANASNKSANHGRICGEVGETVHSLTQPPCAIQAVRRINKADFDALSKKAKQHVGTSPADPAVPAR